MAETRNLHLELTGDDSVNFKMWRELMNGLTDSNMEKIDDAVGGKAEASVPVEAVLEAEGWSEEAPFTQTLTINGMTENGVIGISQSITDEQMEAACYAELRVASQGENTLTIAANGDKPMVDIPVTMILLG